MTTYARLTDPVTSHEAAASIHGVSSLQADILRLFRQFGAMTDEQLVARHDLAGMVSRTPERIRTARHELVRLGEVEWTGEHGRTVRGHRAQVWGIVAPPVLF